MVALILVALSGYLIVVGRAHQGAIFVMVDDWLGEEAAGFILTTLGAALFFVALLRMLSGVVA